MVRVESLGLATVCVLSIAMVALLATSGCYRPQHDGPRISEVPEGFLFDPNAQSSRKILAEFDGWELGAWTAFDLSHDDHASIDMMEYPDILSPEEIRAAYDHYIKEYGRGSQNGELEELEIDGHRAWGWLETQWVSGELAAVEYHAIVPHDDQTFVIEAYASIYKYLDEDWPREMVSRFEVAQPASGLAKGLILLAVLAAGVLVFMKVRSLEKVREPEPFQPMPRRTPDTQADAESSSTSGGGTGPNVDPGSGVAPGPQVGGTYGLPKRQTGGNPVDPDSDGTSETKRAG